MPTISVANPKGGSGKSTTSLVLATTLANKGATIALIDADPNTPLVRWAGGNEKHRENVIGDVKEETIIETIDAEAEKKQFVIVDLEGKASRMTSRAIARSDLVIIPMQATTVDANQAVKAIALIKEEEILLRRKIHYAIVMTRTSPAIKSRIEREIMSELEKHGVYTLKTHLNQRTAFPSMFTFQQDLDELDPIQVNGIAKARDNADKLVIEIINLLNSQKAEQ